MLYIGKMFGHKRENHFRASHCHIAIKLRIISFSLADRTNTVCRVIF